MKYVYHYYAEYPAERMSVDGVFDTDFPITDVTYKDIKKEIINQVILKQFPDSSITVDNMSLKSLTLIHSE